MREDVTDIVLNIKQLALRMHSEGPKRMTLRATGPGSGEQILITGTERGVLSFARCCYPIPGDEIMGYLSAGKGVVVHRMDCPNVTEYRKFPERCVPMAWDRNVEGDYRVMLRIEVENTGERPFEFSEYDVYVRDTLGRTYGSGGADLFASSCVVVVAPLPPGDLGTSAVQGRSAFAG